MQVIRFGLVALLILSASTLSAETPRQTINNALLAEDAEQQAGLVATLAGKTDPIIRDLLTAWKEGAVYFFEAPAGLPGFEEGARIPIILGSDKDAEEKQTALRLDTGAPLQDTSGQPVRLMAGDLEAADTSSELRLAMKRVLDVFALAASDPSARLRVVEQIGLAQEPAQLEAIRVRQKVETDARVHRALQEAAALIQLKSDIQEEQIAAAGELRSLATMSSVDALKQLARESREAERPAVAKAADDALAAIANHTRWVNFYGTLFRGLSLGSILLVVAIGLAITFGLMGVINMAHGELIVVGAYTTYATQNIFGAGLALSPLGMSLWIPGLNTGGGWYDNYFLVALPLSFLVAALVGIALERGVIRFLYRRPLESLLATWGVSLVLQQLFRLVFGANNVQVYSPTWLSGHWTVFDVLLGWNRLFVIGFAIVIIIGTWALLSKTSLGLLIRAVMQNRAMASCVGVRTERVNMLTFGFGSGLAGLAGAFLSQIGNVGPSMGQDYIVNAFMTVVVGGVGSLAGTVVSALGIGLIDQSLQQILLNPVLGKILVLVGIILFLQWRPAGLFVTKSRSLEA